MDHFQLKPWSQRLKLIFWELIKLLVTWLFQTPRLLDLLNVALFLQVVLFTVTSFSWLWNRATSFKSIVFVLKPWSQSLRFTMLSLSLEEKALNARPQSWDLDCKPFSIDHFNPEPWSPSLKLTTLSSSPKAKTLNRSLEDSASELKPRWAISRLNLAAKVLNWPCQAWTVEPQP